MRTKSLPVYVHHHWKQNLSLSSLLFPPNWRSSTRQVYWWYPLRSHSGYHTSGPRDLSLPRRKLLCRFVVPTPRMSVPRMFSLPPHHQQTLRWRYPPPALITHFIPPLCYSMFRVSYCLIFPNQPFGVKVFFHPIPCDPRPQQILLPLFQPRERNIKTPPLIREMGFP